MAGRIAASGHTALVPCAGRGPGRGRARRCATGAEGGARTPTSAPAPVFGRGAGRVGEKGGGGGGGSAARGLAPARAVVIPAPRDPFASRDAAEYCADAAAPPKRAAAPGPLFVGNVALAECLADFREAVEEGRRRKQLVVAAFGAPHCWACRSMYPKLSKLAAGEFADVLWVKVRVGDHAAGDELRNAVGVQNVPVFQLYHQGAVVKKMHANLSRDSFQKLKYSIRYHADEIAEDR